jgi:putative acetyltransferase
MRQRSGGRPRRTSSIGCARTAPVCLGLVAVDGETLVGHILFTSVTLRGDGAAHMVMALAPMSVLPAWQRRGVGAALVRAGPPGLSA